MHSNMLSFKWFGIFYGYLLYMCRPLTKNQEWIFICFIWAIYGNENIC